jgi:hypothetical protein
MQNVSYPETQLCNTFADERGKHQGDTGSPGTQECGDDNDLRPCVEGIWPTHQKVLSTPLSVLAMMMQAKGDIERVTKLEISVHVTDFSGHMILYTRSTSV